MNIIRTTIAIAALIVLVVQSTVAGDPSWKVVAQLPSVLSGHGTAMVHTGDVLVIGGMDAAGTTLADVRIFRGTSGRVDPAVGTLSVPRCRSAIVVVPRGNMSVVYVIGGYTGNGGSYSSVSSVDVITYDQLRDTWRVDRSTSLPNDVGDVRAVVLQNGSIVVSGGTEQRGGALGTGSPSGVSSIINGANGVVARIGDHITSRSGHGVYRFLDAVNAERTLAAGGDGVTPTAELLAGTTWDGRANPPRAPRKFMAPISDISGTARAIGGEDATGALATTEWYDPKSGWRTAPRLNAPRSRMGYTLIAGPTDTATAYLLTAGVGNGVQLRSTEIFRMPSGSVASGTFETFLDLSRGGEFASVAMCAVNLPVHVGGSASNAVEVLQPLSAPPVSFPGTEVGALSDSVPVIITNTWLLPITIRGVRTIGHPDFLFIADTSSITLAPGSSRTFFAWFRPTAAGARSADVVVNLGPVSDTIRLSGTGLASTISLAATGIDHGDVLVGSTSVVCVPILVNNGTDTAVVDSLSLGVGSDVQIQSPIGRVRVAPGDTLRVCSRYSPTSRTTLAETATICIGVRRYPFSIVGRGIRTRGRVVGLAGCDTINAVVGDTITGSIILENTGDLPLTITSIQVDGSVVGSAWLANPNVVPITLQQQQTAVVDYRAIVRREGAEQYTIRCVSNGDTAMEASSCIVVRSRALTSSVSAINIGSVCVGDSSVVTLSFVNPSATETISIDAIAVEGIGGQSTAVLPSNVLPRTTYTCTVVLRALAPGAVNGRVVLSGPFGASAIPITGEIASSIAVDLTDAFAVPSEDVRVAITITNVTSSTVRLLAVHSPSALRCRTIEPTNGTTFQPATSAVSVANGSLMDIVLPSAPPGGTLNCNLVLQTLRSDENRARLYCVRADAGSPCVLSDSSTVLIDTGCGGERSGVRSSSRASMMLRPNPTRSVVTIETLNAEGAAIDLISMDGNLVARTYVQDRIVSVDVSTLPPGGYAVRLMQNGQLLDTRFLIVTP